MVPASTRQPLHATPPFWQPSPAGRSRRRFFRRLAGGIICAALLAVAGSALYLVKSALGIDLLAGHSPLHGLLYSFVR